MSKSCSCSDEAEINATIKFHCKNCLSVVDKYTVKKPLKAAGVAAIIAYCSGSFLSYAVTDNRYPLDIEYAVLEACTNSHKELLSHSAYDSKKQRCLCALEDTMNEISYVRYQVNENVFLASFENNAKLCK